MGDITKADVGHRHTASDVRGGKFPIEMMPEGVVDDGDLSTALAATLVTVDDAITDAIAPLASRNYVASRGIGLVTNGTGLLGDNTNFSGFTFDPTDSPIGGGSFVTSLGVNTTKQNDELIPVDLAHKYEFSVMCRQKGLSGTARAYTGLVPYDAAGLLIDTQHYMFRAGTTTTLAVALNPGDTTITLTSAANWTNTAPETYYRQMTVWAYTDPLGKTWAPETYSRLRYADLYDIGGISGNVITLKTPWAGPAYPAGTSVSNTLAGGSYMYGGLQNTTVPTTWTAYSAIYGGVHTNKQASATTAFPPGTAFVKIVFLPNRTSTGSADSASQHAFAAVSFADAAGVVTTTPCTAASGWLTYLASVDVSSGRAWLRQGFFERLSTSVALTAGTPVTMGTATSPPAQAVVVPGVIRLGAAGTPSAGCECRIETNGSITVNVFTSGTLTTLGYVGFGTAVWVPA